MTYKLRVSLPNIKGFARIYALNEANTLYSFHKQMLADMEFPQDQMVLFKGFDAQGQLVARYATFDLGQGSIEHISLKHILSAGITQFTYFYDTTNKKSVIITIEGEAVAETASEARKLALIKVPTLIDVKGPNPEVFLNGYVAFEDLPVEKQRSLAENDFEDDDEDDDQDGEEDEDIIGEEEDEDQDD